VIAGFETEDVVAQERVLARARLVLAAASLGAIYVDPTGPVRYVAAAFGLLSLYVLASLIFLVVVSRAQRLPPHAGAIAHVFDVISLAILTSLTGAASSPLFPFFTYIVLAAAFRWGYRETLATTLIIIWVMLAEALLFISRDGTSGASPFALNLFLIRVTYMALAGVLLAYMASHEKKLRLESSLVARILSRMRSGTLDAAMNTAGRELLKAFGATSIAIAVKEMSNGQTHLWSLDRAQEEMLRAPLSRSEADAYLAKAPAACILRRGRKGIVITATSRGSVGTMATTLAPTASFNNALVVTVSFEEYWSGRVFVYDPARRSRNVVGLRLLSRVMEFTAPALHSVFLIRRLRSRSEASERARLARELHDTSVQSLIGLEMDVMALSRRAGDPSLRNAIDGIHARLQQEIQGLRSLMAHLSKSAPSTGSITERLTEILARFQVDTGIRTRLLSSAALAAPPRITQELLRLVEAALSNIRRHSGATHADVILERMGDGWMLAIEDDGVGGREGGRQPTVAPWSMRERVTALGGQLVVEPRKNAVGVRVEIRLPAFVLSA
jgi:signal transduction histidine kinase